jgi:dUTPase
MFGYSQREIQAVDLAPTNFIIKKGDKIAQCTLKEHRGYLMGYESDIVRSGGYGSTGK